MVLVWAPHGLGSHPLTHHPAVEADAFHGMMERRFHWAATKQAEAAKTQADAAKTQAEAQREQAQTVRELAGAFAVLAWGLTAGTILIGIGVIIYAVRGFGPKKRPTTS